MGKDKTPTDREVLELFKESLSRTGEGMIDLARELDANGMRPLNDGEKQLLRSAVAGTFKEAMKEAAFMTMAGYIRDVREVLFSWIHRLQHLE